jgi:Holliday junction resolvase RusA-like endonuclease
MTGENKTRETPVITFRVALIPTAKGRPRLGMVKGHARAFTPEKTRTYEETFASMAQQHAPPVPLTGPLAVTLSFELPMPTSWPAWRKAAAGWHFEGRRDDADNIAKAVLDAMSRTGAWWIDDAQVCRLLIAKVWSATPGTTVTIEQLEQPTRPARRPGIATTRRAALDAQAKTGGDR